MKKSLLLLPITVLPCLASCGNAPIVTKEYTIKFVNYNGDVLQESLVKEGALPIYEGETPTERCEVAQHEYVYTGWDKQIVRAKEDTTYIATFDYVFDFGSYPQTLVSDLDLIAQLENITSVDDHGYKTTIDGKQYFEYISEQNYTADDGTKVEIDAEEQIYKYYEVKPIQWKILIDDEDGRTFYTTYKLLVQQIYNDLPESSNPDCNNDYETSVLHTWLNDNVAPTQVTDIGGFYWRAFRNGESILPVDVDVDEQSTCDEDNPYADEEPIQAKVFELSRLNLRGKGDTSYTTEEYDFHNNDDLANPSRTATTTDFARATGAGFAFYEGKYYGMYWTKSPSFNTWTFDDDIYAYMVMTDGHVIHHNVDETCYCARPAIRFNAE
ncbi:MAG: DUF6273 domain-containing protein [Mycoplasmoidaceae bacterium]